MIPLPKTPLNVPRIMEMIHQVEHLLTSEEEGLSDNEIINVAFGVYSTIIINCMELLKDMGRLASAESLRDNSLEQVQLYAELLLERCPRRKESIN